MQRRVLSILSSNYAGSHYLSLMLGSHSQALHLGEIRHLRRPGRAWRNACSICTPPESCPLVRGISPANIQQVFDLIWHNTQGRWPVLVDASKDIRWARRFVCRPDLQRIYVHLIRDPRALVRRWTQTYSRARQQRHARFVTARRLPRHAAAVLSASQPMVYLYKWLQKNLAITDFLARQGAPSLLVTYRDLARNPAAELARITSLADLTYEAGQEDYWKVSHHGSQKPQYAWVKEQQTNHFDLRWQADLTQDLRRQICQARPTRRYLSRLGLSFCEDGLTHS